MKIVIKQEPKLYILGAGGFAREIYSYLEKTAYSCQSYQLAGFLDDRKNCLDTFNLEHQVVGTIKTTQLNDEDVLIIGVAGCIIKKELYDYYKNLKHKFLTFVHPTAIIGHDVIIGEGSVIAPYAMATTNVNIGTCATINAHATLGHDSSIGEFCTLSAHCDITGEVQLGEQVFLGTSAVVIPQVVVESNSIIGAGSVVIKKVSAGTTVFGNPAKKIK